MIKYLLFLLILTSMLLSQDIFIANNPYDKADEYTKTRNSFNRERWFYEQRMFPYNFIPEDAYGRAYEQREQMRRENGFEFNRSVTWSNIGPTPGYYFSYTNISGRTTTVKFHPANPAIIYIGTAFGGVWKTTNSGVSWTQLTDFEVSLSSGSLAIDPSNPNIIYYGTGEATYSAASYYGRGILKSVDGGATWTNITAGLPLTTYCSRIVIRPGISSQLFAAMGTAGFYKSTDAGQNWTQVFSGRYDDIVFSPNGNNAFLTGSGGYRVSTDGGVTFTQNTSVTMRTRNHVAICRDVPSVLYISTYSGTTINVFKSTNSGVNYTQVGIGTNFNGGQAWYDFYMHVNPFDPNYAYVGSIDIWRTTDGGTTFDNITYGYSNGPVHVDQHNMDFNPVNSNELFAVNDGGVWKSSDRGTSWENLNSTLTVTQFYRIASDPSNVNHVLGGTQDNGTQRTLGTINFAAAFGGDGGEVCFHAANNQYMLGETQNNGVQRSSNGGASWVQSSSGLSGTGAWVGPLISHPTIGGIYYTARQQVFKTTDWGVSWAPISSGTGGTIREMAISRSNPNIMYATSNNIIYKSTDGGTTFTSVTSGLPGRTITSVYVHPDSSDVAVITFSGFGAGKVYKTTNGGVNWNNISGNLPDSPTNDVLIYYPGVPSSVYLAAMDIGVFITVDYGVTWVELADGLPNTVAISLDYNLAANKLRIGTHGRGIWEFTNPIGIINYNHEVPGKYSLGQNYPNPFNPVTTLKYQIVKSGDVKLSVYDIVGREIRTIVNENQLPGTYTVQFDASNLTSGVYFYKLITNEFSQTKKMIVVK